MLEFLTNWFNEVAGLGIFKGYYPLGSISEDKSAVRTDNVVYQNTTGQLLLVAVNMSFDVHAANQAYAELLLGSADPPLESISTTGIYSVSSDTSIAGTLIGVVPIGYYYKVKITTAGAGVHNVLITSWWETQLIPPVGKGF